MRQNKYKSQYFFFEKSLLSISSSGAYVNTKELVDIAKKFGIQLAYKKRSIVLQNLLNEIRLQKKNNELITSLCTLLEAKKQEYIKLEKNYKNTTEIINTWIRQIDRTKMLIQKELYEGEIS